MLNLKRHVTKKNNHKPIVFNIILWLFSFVILLFIFSRGLKPIKIDYIYTICFLVTIIIPVGINLYLLLPELLKKERYALYAITFFINLILFSQLSVLFFKPFLDFLFPNYFFVSYHSNTKLITIFAIFLVATTLLKLSEDWFHFNRIENRELKLKNKEIERQLSNLRAHINPHFLFNSLNVIYSLAIEKKEGVTDAILQLSDILRYIIYDSDTKLISLKEEKTLLENYIKFQKFRVHGFQNIKFEKTIEQENFSIYPMLLLPLVENSFKHGLKGDLNDTFINIKMHQKENTFNFVIENNTTLDTSVNKSKYSGVGIEHIKNNLMLVYPKQHIFNITKTKTTYKVDLTIMSNK